MFKFWLPFVLLLITACSGFADTIVLKTGEKIEGTVTAQTATDVTITVKISQGVTDDRTILRTDIQSMGTEPADEVAFRGVKDLKPADNAFVPNAFDGEVGALQDFLDKFPKSTHVVEVRGLLATFSAEQGQLEKGFYKVNGKWMTKDDAMKQRYEISAQSLFTSMQGLVTGRDLIGAMNTFTQLEKSYAGARVYPDAVDLARQIVASLHPDIDRRLEVWQHDEEARVAGLELTAEPEKSELIAAAKNEVKKYETICTNATKSGLKWVPLLPRSERSLTMLQTLVASEEQRLSDIPVEAMHQSVQAIDKASEDIEEKDAASAENSLREAGTLWPNNHALADMNAQLAKLKIEIKATPTPIPVVVLKPTPKPVPSPAAAASAGIPHTPGAPAGAAPAAGSPSAPRPAVAPPAPADDGGILSTIMSPIGMLALAVIVMAGAGGAFFVIRQKKQKEATVE